MPARGHLPQGAPTGGALANLVMREVDREITAYADRHGLVCKRYSDDVVLSTRATSPAGRHAAINNVTNTLAARGLRVHRTKTRIITPGARKIVLGLLVDGERPRLLPEFKRRLEVHVRRRNVRASRARRPSRLCFDPLDDQPRRRLHRLRQGRRALVVRRARRALDPTPCGRAAIRGPTYHDTLTLTPVKGKLSPSNFRVYPWRLISQDPSLNRFSKRCPPPAAALAR